MGKWQKSFAVGLNRPKREYTFGPPATATQLKAVERALGGKLPADVRALLSEFNGVWRPYEDMEDIPEQEIVYFSTDGMLADVPDYLRNWGDPPKTPSGIDLRKVVFVGQVNGFADLYGVCLESVGEFPAGAVVKLDHETGELEEAFESLKEFVEDGPK